MIHRKAALRTLAALTAVLLLSAGCGSDNSDGGSTAQGSDDTAAPTESVVVKVGGILDGLSFSGADDGFKARIERANRDKELGNVTIDYVGATDVASAPDKALSTAQDLVDRQGVDVVAPVLSTGAQAAFGQYLSGRNVPYFGAGFTPVFCKPSVHGFSPIGCAVGGSKFGLTGFEGLASALGKKPSDLTWAFIGLDIPDGQRTVDKFVKGVERLDGQVVYSKASLPQGGGGDLQPFVSAIMNEEPDVVWPLAGAEVIGFKAAMKAAGFKGALVDAALYSPGLLGIQSIADALEGTYVQATTPVLEEGLPFAKQMEKDFKAAGDAKITFGGMYAYMSADMLVDALEKVDGNVPSIVKTLSKGWKYLPAKGGNPMEYPLNYDAPTACSSFVKVENKTYKVAVPFRCGELVDINE